MMKNAVYYQEKGAIRLLLENLLVGLGAIFLVFAGIAVLVVTCKLAFAGFMLLPYDLREIVVGVMFFALVATVLWKLKEFLALLAVVCHVFS
jgi:hypothetical protein